MLDSTHTGLWTVITLCISISCLQLRWNVSACLVTAQYSTVLLCSGAFQVYCQVSGQDLPKTPTVDVSSQEFYGAGYDDSDKRIPDMTLIHKQLGESPVLLQQDCLVE